MYFGNPGFSAGMANYTDFVFSPSGEPYIAFLDGGIGKKATVMKYDSVITGTGTLQHFQITFYPNPAIDKIIVTTPGAPNDSNLSIVNTEGRELITKRLSEAKTVIDISSLPSGVYFVRLTSDKNVEIGKIVKR